MLRALDRYFDSLSPGERLAIASQDEECVDRAYARDLVSLGDRGLPVPGLGIPRISPERLDVGALWRALPQAERDRIGQLALGIVVGGYIAAEAELTAASASRAGAAHHQASLEALCSVTPPSVVAALKGPSWRIPAGLGPICVGCGCSEGDACEDGCRWMDEARTLCTACGDPSQHAPF
ncbi:hypothetical protein OKC48_16230 [Methylorubrum extorquens]|uniref:hypothetical protein n=1 Tax=Methylorubrum extorquens TaxID=408 RepID=UPI0022390398|nr:hypothetical protein [Methylorubrum extorquens]UYW24821.1 hypothetical protein OKC48_16230 [Methylorubrum extorquens]